MAFAIKLSLFLLLLPLQLSHRLLLGCSSLCLLCDYTTGKCLTCASGFLLTGGICQCPNGQYPVGGVLSCASCDSTCQSCTGPLASDCTSCPSGAFLYQGTCYPNCASSQYFNTQTKTCSSCDPSCLTCDGSTSQSCTSCVSGTLVSGSCKCSSGQYKDSSYICQSCHSTCKECSGPSSNQCTACYSGMIFSNGQCKCSTGTYMNLSPLGCLNCDSTCLGCSGPSSSECTSCKTNMVLSSSGQCICPTATYYDSGTQSCKACDSHCQECSGPLSTQCTSCKNNLQLSLPGQCDCPAGQYLDSTSMICFPCHSSCKTCTGANSNKCTSCDINFTLLNGQCECSSACSCPSGTYLDPLSSTCLPCHSLCQECSGPASNQCTLCASDKNLVSGQCICNNAACSCPTGTFYNSGISNCDNCYENCQTCDDSAYNKCLSCKSNLALSSGVCSCPIGSYLHPTLKVCLDCHESCSSCSGPYSNQCTNCKNNMQLSSSGYCSCPAGLFADMGTFSCLTCDSSCTECTGPENNQCTACVATKTLESNYCLDICAADEYRSSDKSCQKCDSTCAKCSGPTANECTACFPGANLQGGACQPTGCHISCSTCQGPSETDCITCQPELAFVEQSNGLGRCASRCPMLYYLSSDTNHEICLEKTPLSNKLVYNGGFSGAKIILSREIDSEFASFVNNTAVSVSFREDQSPVDYKVLYHLQENKKEILVETTFSNHLLPGNILNIRYDGLESDNSTDYYMENSFQQISLMEYYMYSQSVQNAINTTSAINSVGTKANKAFSWTSSFILWSVHSMRSQVVEDMLQCFLYMNIDFPPNFVQFSLDNQNSLDQFIPNLGSFIIDKLSSDSNRLLQQDESSVDTTLPDNALNKYITDRTFLINFGADLGLFAISFMVLIVIEGLRFLIRRIRKTSTKSYWSSVQVCCDYVSYSLRWNFLLNQFVSVYLNLMMSAVLEVSYTRRLNTSVDYVKYISGAMGLFISILGLIAVPLLIWRIYKRLKDRQEKDTESLKRLSVLHGTFKTEKFWHLLYPCLLILRSAGFTIVLVFLQDVPLIQILYIFLATLVIIAHLAYFRPLLSKAQQILTIAYEALFLTACGTALALHIYNKRNLADIETRTRLGFVICGCSLCMILLNLANAPLEVWELKRLMRSRSQVAPLTFMPTYSQKSSQVLLESKETVSLTRLKSLRKAQTLNKTPLESLKTIKEEDGCYKDTAEDCSPEQNKGQLKRRKSDNSITVKAASSFEKSINAGQSIDSPPISSDITRNPLIVKRYSTTKNNKAYQDFTSSTKTMESSSPNLRPSYQRNSKKSHLSTFDELDHLKPSSGEEDLGRSPSISKRKLISKGSLKPNHGFTLRVLTKTEKDLTSTNQAIPLATKAKLSTEEDIERLELEDDVKGGLMRKRSGRKDSLEIDLTKSPGSTMAVTFLGRRRVFKRTESRFDTFTTAYCKNNEENLCMKEEKEEA